MKTTHEIAMDLSNGSFAWHIFGVLTVAEDKIDLDAEATSYLDTFHEGWDVDEEPKDLYTDAEADADTLASAGMGTDEDYGYAGDLEYF